MKKKKSVVVPVSFELSPDEIKFFKEYIEAAESSSLVSGMLEDYTKNFVGKKFDYVFAEGVVSNIIEAIKEASKDE